MSQQQIVKIVSTVFILCLALTACQHAPQHAAVTSGARTSISQASAATTEAQRASQRSSAHIRAVRGDLGTIDFKASRALKILDE